MVGPPNRGDTQLTSEGSFFEQMEGDGAETTDQKSDAHRPRGTVWPHLSYHKQTTTYHLLSRHMSIYIDNVNKYFQLWGRWSISFIPLVCISEKILQLTTSSMLCFQLDKFHLRVPRVQMNNGRNLLRITGHVFSHSRK